MARLPALQCFVFTVLLACTARADAPLPPPAVVTACSPDQRFCATADPQRNVVALFSRGSRTALWSLPGWHRYFFVANGGEHIIVGPDGLNLLPLNTKLSDPLLTFFRREATVRVVSVGALFPALSSLKRTVSHYYWGFIVGVSPKNQLLVQLAGGKRIAFNTATGLPEPEL